MRKIVTLLLLPAVMLFGACSDDDSETENDADALIGQIEDAMTQGSWKITLYNDSGVVETDDYSNYTFTFEFDGTLVASNGTESFNGLWWTSKDDDSSNDDSVDDNGVDFNIAFMAPELLVELSDDWDVSLSTDTRLELHDISGGDGTTDLLTFEKN